MTRNSVVRSVLLAAGVLVVGACASQPVSSPAPAGAHIPQFEKKVQLAARQYQKYQHEGQVVYCKKEKVITSAIPVVKCLSESELRVEVENLDRWRNPVVRPLMPGMGQGGIG